MRLDRQFLIWGLSFAIVGMGLGIYMAATKSYVQHVTHAHILLVGFVVSLLYGMVHRVWLTGRFRKLGLTQFIAHQVGSVVMFIGLFLMNGRLVEQATLEPLLKGSSLAVIFAAALMLYMAVRDVRT